MKNSKLLSFILSLTMVMTLIPAFSVPVFAAETITTRMVVGTGASYTIPDGASVSGIVHNDSNGAIAVQEGGVLSGTNVTFFGNAGNGYNGGAIYNEGVAVLHNAKFESNVAAIGGAIYNTENGIVTLTGNTIFNKNSADIGSGAIYNAGTVNFSGNTVFKNNSSASIYKSIQGSIYNKGILNFSGCTTFMNILDSGQKSIYNDGSAINIYGTVNMCIIQDLDDLGRVWNEILYNNGSSTLNWNISTATGPGISTCINYFQNVHNSDKTQQTITVSDRQPGGEYTIATGDFTDLLNDVTNGTDSSHKKTFTVKTTSDAGITLTVGGPMLEYKGLGYQLSINNNGTPDVAGDDNLVLTVLEPKVLEYTDFSFTAPSNLKYDGQAKAATVTPLTTMGAISVNYYKGNSTATCSAIGIGKYTVKVDVAKSFYNLAANAITGPSWIFTVVPSIDSGSDGTKAGEYNLEKSFTAGKTEDCTVKIGLNIFDLKGIANDGSDNIDEVNSDYSGIVINDGVKTLSRGSHYTVKKGSVEITLLKSYLDSLNAGSHDISIALSTDEGDTFTYHFGVNITAAPKPPVVYYDDYEPKKAKFVNKFTDVSEGDYFYDAVLWAAENGVTSGKTETIFAPKDSCTRAEFVTFLWRAAGKPVSDYLMPFTDVPEGRYYTEAVRWAAAEGIVMGTTATTFNPSGIIDRAQAIAFLYRYSKAPAIMNMTANGPAPSPFSDVANTSYAYNAVMWAAKKGITSGKTGDTFGPRDKCERAHVVVFLYNFFN